MRLQWKWERMLPSIVTDPCNHPQGTRPMLETAYELRIRFDQLTAAKANVAARELHREIVRLTGGNVQPEFRRETDDSQDIGTIIAIILGTPAVVHFATQVADGIGAFVARLGTRVTIEVPRGRICIEGHAATQADIEAIAKVMFEEYTTK